MKTWVDGHGIKRAVNDVFISYSRSDRRIRLLAERLENENLSVFWDRDIPAGEDYGYFLRTALDNSRLVLVVWSYESIKSDWVYSEAEFARVRKRLVSCRIDECTPNPPFNTFQTVDLSHWRGDKRNKNWRNLVDLIRHRVTGPSATSPIADIAIRSNRLR
jgi:TIR domain-containing protein